MPTVVLLREKLTVKLDIADLCKPLVSALVDGIDKRFCDLFDDRDAVAAALIHPEFKNCWTNDRALIDTGLQSIRTLLTAIVSSTATLKVPVSTVEPVAANLDDDDVFFARSAMALAVPEEEILIQQILTPSDKIAIVSSSPERKEAFHSAQYSLSSECSNKTPIQLCWPDDNNRRTRMTDSLYENLVLLKVNKCLWQ